MQDDVIKQKKTALKIGIALLEEYCPDAFLDPDIQFDAEEKNGIWRVNNVFEREGISEDGQMWTIDGGEIYVEFRKDNGEIIRIGVDD